MADDEEQEKAPAPCRKGEYLDRITIKMFNSRADDPLVMLRGRCLEKDCDVRKYFLAYRDCDRRVMRKIRFTAETCQQEAVDLMHALDRCTHDAPFKRLA